MSPDIDPLLRPFQLKDLQLRNRIVSTSHEPGYAEGGMPTDRYRAYHVEKARGGIGLTMIGGSAVVSTDSPPAFNNLQLYRDEIVPWLRALSDDVHEAGAAVMCQITHLGHRTSDKDGEWLPTVSVTNLREPAHRSFAKEAEPFDLERIAADYGAAAARCADAGLDGIEIESYGHLFDAFLSPALNHRSDEFGGELANRLRFPRMVLDAIRKEVGDDFVVGLRMAVDERLPGGTDFAQGIEIANALTEGGADFLSVIRGHIGTEPGISKVIPPQGAASAPHLSFAGQVREQLDVPTMHAAKIADIATARHAVAEGMVDLVGMTRAHIADPHIVRKIRAGQEERIRPCVGASMCVEGPHGSAHCIHNAATGRELTLPHQVPAASASRRVAVVGAGPGGLEAARVLGERGHEVTVFEAAPDPGGQVRLSAQATHRRDLLGIVDWRVTECRRLGVRFVFNRFIEARELAGAFEVIVVATGGSPNTEFFSFGADHVLDSWDIVSGAVRPAGSVLVYDDHGGKQGLDAVEVLVAAGAHVEWASPERTIGVDVGAISAPPYLRTIMLSGVQVSLLHRLVGVERVGDRFEATFRFTSDAPTIPPEHEQIVRRRYDRIVVEHGTLPNDELYAELAHYSRNGGEVDYNDFLALRPQSLVRNGSGRYELYRIGDAVSSRGVHAAVLDAFRLCVAI